MYSFHQGQIDVQKTPKKSLKKKKNKFSEFPSNPSRIQAFKIIMTGKNEPPFPGKIRMLIRNDLPNYIHIPLYSHDRTISEWHTLFEFYDNWNKVPQREIGVDEEYNPFFHMKAAGVLLRKEYNHQMKMRLIIQKWVQRCRTKIYRRRIIGDTDLRTLEPIANKDAIEVVCNRTKTIYRFHVHSIIRMIKENLYYEQWGRADPMDPRNPYTNESWSLHQLIELIYQIQMVVVSRREILPSFLSRFVEARYSVNEFFNNHKLELGIGATKRFFQTPDSTIIRSELLQQLFEQIHKQHKLTLVRRVQQKRCPPLLQECWETLIQDKWIHDNYGYSPRYMWRDILEQTLSIQRLYQKSLQWHTSQMPSIVILSLQEPLSSEEDGSDSP